MTNTSWTTLAVALCTVLTSTATPAQSATDNVLIIVADDLGVDMVGAYGESVNAPPTPNLDALASGGVLFRNAWSNAVCSPTRACIQTGRYSLRTRIGHVPPNPLPNYEMCIPEALDAGGSGYAHGAFGKWHLGNALDATHPNACGWSHYAGMVQGAPPDYFAWPRTVNGSTNLSFNYATTQTVDDALAWIGAQTGPWVCYLAFAAVHTPIHEPPAHLHSQNLSGLDPTTTPIPFHAAMVEALDAEIGRLLAGLGTQGASTNVIFLGDNGTERLASQPPFQPSHAKSSPYEGGINVPLLVSGPAVQSPGREVDALVGAVDVFTTTLELAGVDAAAVVPAALELDGVSFAPYLGDPQQTPLRTMVYAEQFRGILWPQVLDNGFAAVRDAQYKLIRSYSGTSRVDELYDLVADPFELTDLTAGTLTGPQQAALTALGAQIDRLRTPRGVVAPFGTADCVGSNGNPKIGGVGNPTIGGSYDVTLTSGAVNAPASLLIGISDAQWGALALPFDMVLLRGGPSCVLHTSGEAVIPHGTTATGTGSMSVAIPFDLNFVGLRLFHSWLVNDDGAPNNRLRVTVSDGAVAFIGM